MSTSMSSSDFFFALGLGAAFFFGLSSSASLSATSPSPLAASLSLPFVFFFFFVAFLVKSRSPLASEAVAAPPDEESESLGDPESEPDALKSSASHILASISLMNFDRTCHQLRCLHHRQT